MYIYIQCSVSILKMLKIYGVLYESPALRKEVCHDSNLRYQVCGSLKKVLQLLSSTSEYSTAFCFKITLIYFTISPAVSNSFIIAHVLILHFCFLIYDKVWQLKQALQIYARFCVSRKGGRTTGFKIPVTGTSVSSISTLSIPSYDLNLCEANYSWHLIVS